MKTKFSCLFLVQLCLYCSLNAQTQLGQQINGEIYGQRTGNSVAISANGNIFAAGTPGTHLTDNTGFVNVYQLENNEWVQLGQNITGTQIDDQFGHCVAISNDGNILAVGAPLNHGNGWEAGHVRIFNLIDNQWIQKGLAIDGADFDQSGHSVALSSDGNIVAIGAWRNNEVGFNAGQVRVFEWLNDAWVQLGGNLQAEHEASRFGWSISLSNDGQTIACGATHNDGNGENSGHVRVFEMTNEQWLQKGSDIDGALPGDFSGYSVSLSAEGNRLAVGSPSNDCNASYSGHARVFQFNNMSWQQIGNDICGDNILNYMGNSVALSEDGNMVGIAARNVNSTTGLHSGLTRILELNNNQWSQIGNDIFGNSAFNESGYSISISSEGSTISIGAPSNLTHGPGYVRVFTFAQPNIISDDQCFSIENNPDPSQYNFEGDFTNCNIFILDENENVVQFLLNINDKIIINLDDLPAGLHFIRVEHQTHEDLFVQEIIKQ